MISYIMEGGPCGKGSSLLNCRVNNDCPIGSTPILSARFGNMTEWFKVEL